MASNLSHVALFSMLLNRMEVLCMGCVARNSYCECVYLILDLLKEDSCKGISLNLGPNYQS